MKCSSQNIQSPFALLSAISTAEYLPHGSMVHNVFHISQLKKCVTPPIDMSSSDPLLYPKFYTAREPESILDRKMVKCQGQVATKVLVK